MSSVTPRNAERVAYVASGTNLAAALSMLFLLRRGLPTPGSVASDRARYVGQHLGLWRLGWLSWHLAALALIALFVVLALSWKDRSPVLCTLAIVVAAAGLSADLGAEAGLMSIHPASPGFAAGESSALLLTGYVANGLYSLAGIFLTIAGRGSLRRDLLLLGAFVWACGLWLAAETLIGSITGEIVSTVLVMGSFIVWSALLGRWLRTAGS